MDRTVTLERFSQRFSEALYGEALPYVAELTRQKVQHWYAKLPQDWFDNPEPFKDGTPRHAGARTFMQPLKSSWEKETDDKSFTIFFKRKRTEEGSTSNWGLRLQQYGGVIKPVKRKVLTIPVTADARGKRVSTFQKYYNRKLFLVGKDKGKGEGTLVWEDPGGELHAAYVLRKSASVKPLRERRGHDAIPSSQEIGVWASDAFVKRLKFLLENGN